MSECELQPLGDRVLVKKFDFEEKTSGGIVIPAYEDDKFVRGEVLAVGPGRIDSEGRRVPMELAPGDKVLFAQHFGMNIKLAGVTHMIFQEKDIMAKIKS